MSWLLSSEMCQKLDHCNRIIGNSSAPCILLPQTLFLYRYPVTFLMEFISFITSNVDFKFFIYAFNANFLVGKQSWTSTTTIWGRPVVKTIFRYSQWGSCTKIQENHWQNESSRYCYVFIFISFIFQFSAFIILVSLYIKTSITSLKYWSFGSTKSENGSRPTYWMQSHMSKATKDKYGIISVALLESKVNPSFWMDCCEES